MDPWRIGLSTQTPLVRWGGHGGHDPGPDVDAGNGLVGRLRQFHLSPGGVSRMVLQSLRAWKATGRMREAHWFSLQPQGPERVVLDELPVELHHLRLPKEELAGYARMKEKLWADIHGLDATHFGPDDASAFMTYNYRTSKAILEEAPHLDAVYVHDFQLLQVGAMLGLAAPCVLRWHVPFQPALIPRYTRNFLVRMMESCDGVIVSTRRDLEGLTNSGFRGRVRQVYPHTDPNDWKAPTASAVQQLEDRTGIHPDAPVVLCVARMDPMKRQDLLIEAFSLLRHAHPKARLLLVGNGSFSGSKASGLGLTKAERWRAHLELRAREVGVADRTVFTGWMPDELVRAAYARADVLVLPSDIEGFGLTPFEAWGYRKPCVVTRGCGASEVVQDGLTGHTVPSRDPQAMADALGRLLAHPEHAARMGEAGAVALHGFTAASAADTEWAVLEDARRRFERQA